MSAMSWKVVAVDHVPGMISRTVASAVIVILQQPIAGFALVRSGQVSKILHLGLKNGRFPTENVEFYVSSPENLLLDRCQLVVNH